MKPEFNKISYNPAKSDLEIAVLEERARITKETGNVPLMQDAYYSFLERRH